MKEIYQLGVDGDYRLEEKVYLAGAGALRRDQWLSNKKLEQLVVGHCFEGRVRLGSGLMNYGHCGGESAELLIGGLSCAWQRP